ncbi:MAG TPA: cellulase family glycosylhydrolase [Lacipirellulaceae bacterium]|nr:cellulase family glycosylhydrolase [Lacipirellulaceae bacterium]
MVAGLLCTATKVAADDLKSTLTRRGDKLFDGQHEFRFVSFNIPNLMVIEDAYEFTRPNPWRWPNDYEIEDAIESVRQMGGQVVRTYVLSVYREGSDMGRCVHVRGPGKFNEEGFRALDKVIEVAHRKGIRVIIPFVDQANWWGGVAEYAAFRGKPAQAFWSDPQIKSDFKATIRHLITRKNSYTGVAYRDEPAIFGWETGNEINPTPEWTREIAAYIKQLDDNHLVLDGNSLHGVPTTSLDDPNIDVITTHHYPWGADHDFAKAIRAAHALTRGKKAYVVGEFGFVETRHLADAMQTVIDDGVTGALLWSLRMHRREGGFYWHTEGGTGRNIYKAYHWPGFTSGNRYDECGVLKLLRQKAYEIRGLEPPPLERPASPKLLPIEKTSAISWQGSTGASGYDVWRAPAPSGPWEKIAHDLSDADVQYRPLFNDDSGKPGTRYWYRVFARNAVGDSAPSNMVGPVAVNSRTLVDECRDLSLTAGATGKVSPASEVARAAREDCHRLILPPGSAVVYRVKEPIRRWRVYAFAPADANLSFAVSSDGKQYQPAVADHRAFPSGASVYEYLTPNLFTCELRGRDATLLRISNEQTHSNDSGRNDAIELSRVEIENGPTDRQQAVPPKPPVANAVQLNSSIFIDGIGSADDALRAIDAAAARGERQLNVVVTVRVDLTDDLRIKSLGSFDRSTHQYKPFDDDMRRALRQELHQVFASMVKHGMAIYVLPHIDAGGDVQTWRNWIDFDPLTSYSGFTYADLMLGTIADALAETTTPDTHIEMALSGEMGTSLFRYPESYLAVVRQLRGRPKLKQLRIGISLNHGGIAGQRNPSGAPDFRLSKQKQQHMQCLIDDCDFVGMSCYAPISAQPTADDFVHGIDRFMGEFQQYGLRVPTTKPMQFSEVGLGGGHVRYGEEPDPLKATQSPWEGSGNPHNNPWRTEPMQKLRRQYHKALLEFLTTQPARWRVSAAFFWSMGSWDPIGQSQPEFADAEIIAAIEKHNAAVKAGL